MLAQDPHAAEGERAIGRELGRLELIAMIAARILFLDWISRMFQQEKIQQDSQTENQSNKAIVKSYELYLSRWLLLLPLEYIYACLYNWEYV